MLELYQFESCPFCAKVRQKLTALGIDYIIRNVPRSEPEKREFLKQISGNEQVPVLVDLDNNVIMKESDDIIAYLDKHFS